MYYQRAGFFSRSKAALGGATNTAERLTTVNLLRSWTMAAKNSTSRRRRNEKQGQIVRADAARKSDDAPSDPQTEIPRALRDAIEAERARLMDAEAILHCVVLALDASDGSNEQGPYYQRVIDVARDKVVTAIEQLDSVSLRTVLRYVTEGDEVGGVSPTCAKHAVRECASEYLH